MFKGWRVRIRNKVGLLAISQRYLYPYVKAKCV
nr:MAG TPA: hypothetical protein [Caudoviricetes sp.]